MKTKIIIFLVLNSSFLIHNTSKAQMFWNQAASFAGNNTSYISIPNSSSINLTGSFTIEAWVNPSTFALFGRGIVAKGGTLGTSLRFGVRILTDGRVILVTNGAPRCTTATALQTNTWTHLCVTYNSTSGQFKMYLNGGFDASTTIAGAAPSSNTDSLFIGISGNSTPFAGQLDEVRIWNRELGSSEVTQYSRTSLGTSSGIYEGLVLSMTFQKESSSGTKFTTRDFSGNLNNGNARNITSIDQSFRPLNTFSMNQSAEFDGDEDYIAGKDTSTLDPSDNLCLECWVYPRTVQTCNLITKGNLSNPSYALLLLNNIVQAKVNGNLISTSITIPVNQWSKITFQYSTNLSSFHIDGKFKSNYSTPYGNILSSTDSLYIGGAPGFPGDLNGFMDEIRIMNHVYDSDTIYSFTYTSMDKSNDPSPSFTNICYNLDGTLNDNAENGGPKLFFRNNARFSHPGNIGLQPVTPLDRDNVNSLSDGYYIFVQTNQRIPSSGLSGTTTMTVPVYMNKPISDIDVFVALKHNDLSSLAIYLIGPNNDSVRLINNFSALSADNNLETIFNDQADSSIASNKYASLCTTVKPENNLNSVFAGQSPLGTWKIRIIDGSAVDTGTVIACGIRFNNTNIREQNFDLTNFIQGFYDPSTNFQVPDTISVCLREIFSPYAKIDSAKGLMGNTGHTFLSFANISLSHPYYIQLNHRNSIETWSSSEINFNFDQTAVYNFFIAAGNAFGNNQILVDNSPIVRFAIYGGDVTQDGTVDQSDLIDVFNDANTFTSGYVKTDMTGDNLVDVSDVILTYNNSINFVSVIRP